MDEVQAHAADNGPLPSRADERMRAMFAYSLKLTHEPSKMVREDLDPLRAAGLDDQAILELNQVVAYFAYVNRVIDGLGVQLESFHTDDTG